jgi:hypothetical protein
MNHLTLAQAPTWLLLLATLLVAPACQSADEGDASPQVGGESHWLMDCQVALDCGQGEVCLCGQCTTPCGQEACAPGATCAQVDTCDVSICRATCEVDADCDGGTCEEGACVLGRQVWGCAGTQERLALSDQLALTRGEPASTDSPDCVDLSAATGVHCAQPEALVEAVLQEGQPIFYTCWPGASGAQPLSQVASQEGQRRLEADDPRRVFTVAQETLQGQVWLAGARQALYGQGVESSTLGGDVIVQGNQVRLRGLTVDAALGLQGNGAAVTGVRVTGDVTVSGNNAALVDVEVHGDLLIEGNGITLIDVGVGGQVTHQSATTNLCHGCYSFEDQDQDRVITPQEHLGSLCPLP